MTIIMARDGELKHRLPTVTEKSDGTLWFKGMPLLAVKDPAEKAKITKLVKARKYSEIPKKFFARMGKNPDGVWVGDEKEWENNPARIAVIAQKEIEEAKQGSIYLSSRGWGDYSPVVWTGDITRETAEILAECRKFLNNASDVDKKNQTDGEIIARINEARAKKQKTADDKKGEDTRRNVLLAKAQETGEKQVIKSWLTDECSEHGRIECSFDLATLWAMPDGTTKTTYKHCF